MQNKSAEKCLKIILRQGCGGQEREWGSGMVKRAFPQKVFFTFPTPQNLFTDHCREQNLFQYERSKFPQKANFHRSAHFFSLFFRFFPFSTGFFIYLVLFYRNSNLSRATPWCNGSTTGFGPVSLSSNLGGVAIFLGCHFKHKRGNFKGHSKNGKDVIRKELQRVV